MPRIDPTPYAEQIASGLRLKACGGDWDRFLAAECDRIDALFAPLRRVPSRKGAE